MPKKKDEDWIWILLLLLLWLLKNLPIVIPLIKPKKKNGEPTVPPEEPEPAPFIPPEPAPYWKWEPTPAPTPTPTFPVEIPDPVPDPVPAPLYVDPRKTPMPVTIPRKTPLQVTRKIREEEKYQQPKIILKPAPAPAPTPPTTDYTGLILTGALAVGSAALLLGSRIVTAPISNVVTVLNPQVKKPAEYITRKF